MVHRAAQNTGTRNHTSTEGKIIMIDTIQAIISTVSEAIVSVFQAVVGSFNGAA